MIGMILSLYESSGPRYHAITTGKKPSFLQKRVQNRDMGRHKNYYDIEQFSVPMSLRMTPGLLTSVDSAAAEAVMHRSDFVREILLRHLLQDQPAPRWRDQRSAELIALVDAIEKAVPETRAVGVLLNQGLKRLHATGKLDVLPGLRVACDRYLIVSQAEHTALSHLLRL
jgi:hypothetical protein